VRQLIRRVQPDVVLLELDEGRAARLQNGESASLLGFLRVGVSRELIIMKLSQAAVAWLLHDSSDCILPAGMQSTLPGVLIPGSQWGGNVVKLGVGGM
jgi:hypothetical protein